MLGGTSLFGGKGTVVGSIMGALMIGLINNRLILAGRVFLKVCDEYPTDRQISRPKALNAQSEGLREPN